MNPILHQLIELSRDLGRTDRKLAILGEGNTSARANDESFYVKASGASLATMNEGDFTQCRFAPLLALLDHPAATDVEVSTALLASRVDPNAKRPSTEAVFHAYLLTRPGILWVAHTHPVSVNGVVCSPQAKAFAEQRRYPDEIVCCGPRSAIIPYVDPGMPLARAIREAMPNATETPRVILLCNHGMIAPAGSAAGAMAATLMADKSADIFTRAVTLGGAISMDSAEQLRIESRDDEAYRRKQLGI